MFLAMAGGSKMSKTRRRPPTIFTFRLLTLALAAAVFVLESYREPGSILKGHRRRQAMQVMCSLVCEYTHGWKLMLCTGPILFCDISP